MKKYTEEEVLELVVGEIGTLEREDFETQLKKEVDEFFSALRIPKFRIFAAYIL